MRKLVVIIAAASIFLSGVPAYSESKKAGGDKGPAEAKAVKKRILSKSVQGEVSGIGIDFIAITYSIDSTGRSEKEILLPIDPSVSIQNRRSIKEIQLGDIVGVNYEEVTEEDDKGPRTNRRARTITFVRAAPVEVDSDLLDTETADEVTAPTETEEGLVVLKE